MQPLPIPLRLRTSFVALAAAALWLPLPAATIPSGVQLHPQQEFTRGIGAEPESLDPALVESFGASEIVVDMFEGLTAINSAGATVPGVALAWKQTDPLTWVFSLRKNAVFSNGDAITAEDFVYAWRRFMDPKTGSRYAGAYAPLLANGQQVNEGKQPPSALGVQAIDAYTLQVKTSSPMPFLPHVLVNPQFAPVSKKVIEQYGKDWTKPGKLVGNGPYVLKEWEVNNKVITEKNPRYWNAAGVTLTRVTYLPTESPNAAVQMFRSGETDLVWQLPPGSYPSLKSSFPNEVRNTRLLGLRFFVLNSKDPLLSDIRVRKALSMVLDRDILAAKVTADGQIPLYGLAVPGVQGADTSRYDWADWPMERRVAEAKKLLNAAGVKPGTRLNYKFSTGEYHQKMAVFAAAEWKNKLGLETSLENLEFKVLLRARQNGEYQIARAAWSADYNDISSFLPLVQCNSSVNDSHLCTPAAEALISKSHSAKTPAERKALLTEAARVALDAYPIIPLVQDTLPRLVKSYVGGYYESNAIGRARSMDLYIIKH